MSDNKDLEIMIKEDINKEYESIENFISDKAWDSYSLSDGSVVERFKKAANEIANEYSVRVIDGMLENNIRNLDNLTEVIENDQFKKTLDQYDVGVQRVIALRSSTESSTPVERLNHLVELIGTQEVVDMVAGMGSECNAVDSVNYLMIYASKNPAMENAYVKGLSRDDVAGAINNNAIIIQTIADNLYSLTESGATEEQLDRYFDLVVLEGAKVESTGQQTDELYRGALSIHTSGTVEEKLDYVQSKILEYK